MPGFPLGFGVLLVLVERLSREVVLPLVDVESSSVGASLRAGLTAYAQVRVHEYNAVILLLSCSRWSHLLARRFLTMHTQNREVASGDGWELTQLSLQDSSPKCATGCKVGLPAANLTGVAANASFQIDYHSIPYHWEHLLLVDLHLHADVLVE